VEQRQELSYKKRLYTLKEAGEFLGRSIYSVRSLIWNGELPIVKSSRGRKQWLDINDLNMFIEKNKVKIQ